MNDETKPKRSKFEPVRSDFLVFGSPQIEQAEIDEVLATMCSGWLGTGPKVARFEGDFARYKQVDPSFVAALNSCTAALHLSLRAANFGPGDEVITTALTFCATVNAIIHAGATPVLADVNAHTMNIDPNAIEAHISPKTRAILPVHLAGRACDMAAIMEIAERHNLLVIEDCAHAIETEYRDRKAGTIGDFGCFSFYVTKNVVTGEGGMVIARNTADIKRIKSLALHGLSKDAWKRFSDSGYKHYRVEECGFKYNMMDLQAAIGIHQLARVDENWERRRVVWNHYQEAFRQLPVSRPPEPAPDTRHAHHLYTLLIDEEAAGISRDAFLDAMTQQNIGVGVHYLSIPEHPYYRQTFGWRAEDYPNAMRIGQQTVSLPLSAKLTDTDVEDVVRAVRRLCN
ncbi:MAG: DegT/DnrJ/EryC1/StrS family aminotransferase [Gammaproteobacteria bacterium]|nr:DegT/DnrJ/EryC1/StrS family aminotransferase [Gammaproteobacteria bacterium]MCI0591500.1 DegT/DnrJ/EryC1/StrS family aminotransferase [Gammaproteobacteria bacterium]